MLAYFSVKSDLVLDKAIRGVQIAKNSHKSGCRISLPDTTNWIATTAIS